MQFTQFTITALKRRLKQLNRLTSSNFTLVWSMYKVKLVLHDDGLNNDDVLTTGFITQLELCKAIDAEMAN